MPKKSELRNHMKTQLDNLGTIADGLFQKSNRYINREMDLEERQEWSRMLDKVYDSYRNLNYWVFDKNQKVSPEFQQFHDDCNKLYQKLSKLIDQYIKGRKGEAVDFTFLKNEEKQVKKSLINVKEQMEN